MNLFRKIQDRYYGLMAAGALALMETSPAHAQSKNVGQMATDVTTQVGQIGKFAVQGCVLGGVVMVATGLMKLKQAADTQGQQVKYGEGLFRLAVGAGLVGVPALTGNLSTTFGLNGASVQSGPGF